MNVDSELELRQIVDWLRPTSSLGNFIRIGGDRDGAYVLPEDLMGVSACFSPGVSNRKDFEDELLNRFDIGSHLMDASSDLEQFRTPLVQGRQTFIKKWLMPQDGEDSQSLATWVNSLDPGESDLILQMDIEGAEFANLGSAPRQVLKRFRIIVVELHGLGQMNNAEEFLDAKGELFRNLMLDFSVVHLHPNNCCGAAPIAALGLEIPKVLEVTLLRKNRLAAWAKTEVPKPTSPSELDIRWNVDKNPPLFLDNFFLTPEISQASREIRASLMLEWEVHTLKKPVGDSEKQDKEHHGQNDTHRWWSRAGKSK